MIGPRLGFPRKKYVQRKPSPTTLIRHAFTNQATGNLQLPSGVVATAGGQQMNTLMPQPAGHQNIQHHQTLATTVPQQQPQHGLHQNSNGQYVLVHRAHVGAADNQAPRASSAPPVPQNQVSSN